MKRIPALMAFIFFASVARTQTTISGQVKNEHDKNGLSGVNMIVKDKNANAFLAYSITNEAGTYQLNFKSTADSIEVIVSGLNLKKTIDYSLKQKPAFKFRYGSGTTPAKRNQTQSSKNPADR